MKHYKNAQIATTDLITAVSLFIIVISIVFIMYVRMNDDLYKEVEFKDMKSVADNIVENLVRSEGAPENWDHENVRVVGLAKDDRVLMTEKLANFTMINYSWAKRLMGLANKEFYFYVKNLDGETLLEAGVHPEEDPLCNKTYEAVTSTRLAMWDSSVVKLYFTVWKDLCARRSYSNASLFKRGSEVYVAIPEEAFEEDNDPVWSYQVQAQNDGLYLSASDEGLIKPDYVQFSFPDMDIPPGMQIDNVTLTIVHRDDLAGGQFPLNEDYRKMVKCWDGNWQDVGQYEVSEGEWANYTLDISSCVTNVDIANNLNIRINYDPAYDSGGKQDIDYVEVKIYAS